MSVNFKFWDDCTDPADMEALWLDPTISKEWLDVGETKGEKVHLSRDPCGQPYLTQTEMRTVVHIIDSRHFRSTIDQDMICTISELESARQPFATQTTKKEEETTYGLMQLTPKTAEWLFRDLGYQDYEIEGDPSFLYKPFINIYLGAAYLKWLSTFDKQERSEEFVVRAFKGGVKKATHKSTLPYWSRYLTVKESLPPRNQSGEVPSKGQTSHSPKHPTNTQDTKWDSRASAQDMEELWSRRQVYREWVNSGRKKGNVQFSLDEKKRPYLSPLELMAVAEIILSKHFSTSGITPIDLCALAEVVSMRYVDGVGSKTGLMGVDYETAKHLHDECGYDAYKIDSVAHLKNPFASMYFGAAYMCWLSNYEDRERSPQFVLQAYLSGPKNVNLEGSTGPDHRKYKAAINSYEKMRKDQDGCVIM